MAQEKSKKQRMPPQETTAPAEKEPASKSLLAENREPYTLWEGKLGDEKERLDFMRGRESDYVVEDRPGPSDGVPIENLYSAAGFGDLHREGDTLDVLTDLPDVPTETPLSTEEEELKRTVLDAIESEVAEDLKVSVLVDASQVTLRGVVDDADIRDLIGETVEAIPSVGAVLNEIRVTPLARS